MTDGQKKLLHWVITAIVVLLGFYLSDQWYFKLNPLFDIIFLAEILISLSVGLIYYFWFLPAIKAIGKFFNEWIVKTIRSAVSGVVEEIVVRYERRNQQVEKEDNELQTIAKPLVLDTSVIIDGRVIELILTGIFDNVVVVPSIVIEELKHISDSPDKLRKARGRRGLDYLSLLENDSGVDYRIVENGSDGHSDVDQDIVRFVKTNNARLATSDVNLAKSAKARKIQVININELSDLLKPPMLPGDKMTITLIQKGKSKDQAVGYLEDGTMIVVESARQYITEEKEIAISRFIQTKAGKMYFAELVN
jgi:uncharacterized protein YacL